MGGVSLLSLRLHLGLVASSHSNDADEIHRD
jgi:hypothetical protein